MADADPAQLQRAPDRGAVARAGRQARRHACATARAPAGVKPSFELSVAAAGRGGARHQQVQQQRDGAAAVPDAGAAAPAGQPATRRGRARGAARLAGGAPGRAAPTAWCIDNGSGLSRETRLSAALLARLLQQAWTQPGDARADELAADQRPRRHAAPLARHRRAART